MSSFEESSFSVDGFSGRVRLFPLPNLVLFPHVLQPLHVFEPRYRDLLEDAVVGDRLIAMAVLRPGWQHQYEGRPPLYPVACLGHVTGYRRLPDGTYNVLLLGLRRVNLLGELRPTKTYREAAADVWEDRGPSIRWANGCDELRKRLRAILVELGPKLPAAKEQLHQLLAADLSLGTLTDLMGYLLDMGIRRKQALLAERDVCRRAELLLDHFSTRKRPHLFPPHFSVN